MSLKSEDFRRELIYDIFRTHPMWNYKFYLIIESFYEDNLETVGIGFKNIKIKNKTKNELYISKLDCDTLSYYTNLNEFNFDLYDNTCALELICENGLTHDGTTHRFIDDTNNNIKVKRNILIMEMERNEREFRDRIEKLSSTITAVKNAWILENVKSSDWKTSGFDAMSNEIFIQSVGFTSNDIRVLDMPEEIAREKARIAVSKLF